MDLDDEELEATRKLLGANIELNKFRNYLTDLDEIISKLNNLEYLDDTGYDFYTQLTDSIRNEYKRVNNLLEIEESNKLKNQG